MYIFSPCFPRQRIAIEATGGDTGICYFPVIILTPRLPQDEPDVTTDEPPFPPCNCRSFWWRRLDQPSRTASTLVERFFATHALTCPTTETRFCSKILYLSGFERRNFSAELAISVSVRLPRDGDNFSPSMNKRDPYLHGSFGRRLPSPSLALGSTLSSLFRGGRCDDVDLWGLLLMGKQGLRCCFS